ncbi:unnamed protein product [Schistosoma turkestanicum]|nr:unnamed protein product [Schistosoma turkestanicum]
MVIQMQKRRSSQWRYNFDGEQQNYRLSHVDVVRIIKERSDVEMLVAQPKDLAHFRKSADVISAAVKDPIKCETSEEDLNKLTSAEKHLIKADLDTMHEIYQRKRSLLKANDLTNRLQHHGLGGAKNGERTPVNYGFANVLKTDTSS